VAADQYFPTPPAKDEDRLGRGIQRTMTLLATSTPQHRNRVRILFYGQSITEQTWSKAVTDDLRRRFPDADLQVENRAIGGFASQLLVRPAEHDLYPFYPDLLIFHVYGGNKEYEEIIRAARARTTTEILMQRDHLTKWPPDVIDKDRDKGAWWDDLMNEHILPDIAAKYGCGLADVRGGWTTYLKANHLEPKDLLKDGVHLNDHGNHLMARLVEQYLVHRPDLPRDPWAGLVTTVDVGKGATAWKDGKLVLEFEGNRVDVVATTAGGRAEVRVDGKRPSEFDGCYRITRPSPGPWSPLFLARVDHERPLVPEDWTLKVTDVGADGKSWKFDVRGSVTGPDGAGGNDAPFVSKSGRVRIDPAAFFRGTSPKLPAGYECRWTVVPMFVDTYEPAAAPDPARENVTTLVQGLPNAKHTLELSAGAVATPPAISEIRVYRPPVR
jgi:hypothetical protein